LPGAGKGWQNRHGFRFSPGIHSPIPAFVMIRSLLTLALSVFLLAEASAQTAPAAAPTTKAKSAKATARTSRRAAKKAHRVALKKAPAAPLANDGWPPLEDAQPAVASAAAVDAAGTYGAAAPAPRADTQLVYAGPGMPVHIRTSREPVPYSVRPPRKPAAQQTTLGN